MLGRQGEKGKGHWLPGPSTAHPSLTLGVGDCWVGLSLRELSLKGPNSSSRFRDPKKRPAMKEQHRRTVAGC